MSPIHIVVWGLGLSFQLANASCIGGWLGGYGPTSMQYWQPRQGQLLVGLALWTLGLLGNIYHDDALREIRRTEGRRGEKVDKVYQIPQGGLFGFVLYPHYLCEWIEWLGFWVVGGRAFVPARSFLVNEIATMAPRAVSGRRWYLKRFGKEKIAGRAAIIPGIL
jgi:3-oxo-5-alpha-steroid 4-dehydrogenase 1